jgi:uncharacterized protein YjbI with pentapeptide repeats
MCIARSCRTRRHGPVSGPDLPVRQDVRVTATGRRRQTLLLGGTLLVAVAVTAGISAWVHAADPAAGLAEAMKTGGLAGAAVVALYGLWLNDRRRRVEEARQAVDEDRLRLDGDRIGHERFAKAVELLGNEADQSRVGAMHALVGLARGTPEYTQTVIDVLCSYLRRPFFHYGYLRDGPDPDRSDSVEPDRGRLSAEETADDRERQVRLTAQRVLLELLPAAGSAGPAYDLDLTGASLEYLDLAGRRVGGLRAHRATFFGITRLGAAEFTGRVMLSGAVFRGRVELVDTRFPVGFSLERARLLAEVDLSGAVFGVFADLRWQTAETVLLDGAAALPGVELKLPPGVSVPA